MGLYSSMWFLGMVVGPGLGGLLAETFTEAVPFFVCGGLAFLSMILVAFLVEETFRSKWNVEESQKEPTSVEKAKIDASPKKKIFSGMTLYPRTFLGLCVAGFIISFSSSLIQPILSVFAEEELGVSTFGVGVLFSAMEL